jgi:hypothetical protein
MSPAITDLPELVAALPHEIREAFNRIFDVEVVRGALKPPPEMLPWIQRQFGSIDRVTGQDLVKVINRFTQEGTVYNSLRALRPHQYRLQKEAIGVIEAGEQDPFARPLLYTTEDPFGRLEGKYCITAGNVAKYEGHHGVIIFDERDPLQFDREKVADYLDTGWRWAQRAHGYDPEACYYLFLWNSGGRAGASLRHGHAQVLQLRQAAASYKEQYGRNYFQELFTVHEALGLGWQTGEVQVIAYLAALKQNEVMLLATEGGICLADGIYQVLACFRDKMGVRSFNVGIAYPPFGSNEGWDGFPVVARMLDRGDLTDLSSDIGAMEFYGANVVSSDPFITAEYLQMQP